MVLVRYNGRYTLEAKHLVKEEFIKGITQVLSMLEAGTDETEDIILIIDYTARSQD